jgi:hypothetical protein
MSNVRNVKSRRAGAILVLAAPTVLILLVAAAASARKEKEYIDARIVYMGLGEKHSGDPNDISNMKSEDRYDFRVKLGKMEYVGQYFKDTTASGVLARQYRPKEWRLAG